MIHTAWTKTPKVKNKDKLYKEFTVDNYSQLKHVCIFTGSDIYNRDRFWLNE